MSADGRGGFPNGPQSRREGGILEQRLENLILIGLVTEVDEDDVMVRVQIGYDDGSDQGNNTTYISYWLPIMKRCSFLKRTQEMPCVNEQVVVLNPSGLVENGFIIGSLGYYDPDKDQGYPHPSGDKHDERTFWGDWTKLEDMLDNALKTFNRKLYQFWHYFTGGGSPMFRWEIGKDQNKSTSFQIEDGNIEARVGSTKITLDADNLGFWCHGNAACVQIQQDKIQGSIQTPFTTADVPPDDYGGDDAQEATASSTKKTSFTMEEGFFELVMSKRMALVLNEDDATGDLSVVLTLAPDDDGNGKVQLLVSEETIEFSFKDGLHLTLQDDYANLEIDSKSCRLSLGGSIGAMMQCKDSWLLLQEGIVDLRTTGTSATMNSDAFQIISLFNQYLEEAAPGAPYIQGGAPQDMETIPKIDDPSVPDDLARPDIDIGINPTYPDDGYEGDTDNN